MSSSRNTSPPDRTVADPDPEVDRADGAALTPEERARLLAEAEFEAAERSIREEGTITAEELRRHLDAMFEAWEAEEAAAARGDKT